MGLISGRLRGGALKPGFRMLPFGYKEHIETIELESDQSSVTFSDIPDSYEALELYIEAIATGSSTSTYITPRFNDDTTEGNYEAYRLRWDDSVSASIRDTGEIGFVNSSDRNTNAITTMIEGYSNEDMKTTYTSNYTLSEQVRGQNHNGWWDNTAVITKVDIQSATEDYTTGSRFVLHGVNRV